MNANAKLLARRRAREAQRKSEREEVPPRPGQRRRRRDDPRDAAQSWRCRYWERKRLDQAAEHVRADAAKRRAGYFSGLQAAVDQMRDRGQTLATIAALVEVDVREIQAALRRARTGDVGGGGLAGRPGAGFEADSLRYTRRENGQRRPQCPTPQIDVPIVVLARATTTRRRCIRCDAVMLDADNAPRRGRRRLYCSDTCRRDASAARTAAERYGSPIRVVEVPRAGS